MRKLPVNFTHAQEFIDALIAGALKDNVSDIHLERRVDNGIVRVRTDGLMRQWVELPLEQMDLVISRIKFISGIDPMSKGLLQQARFTFKETGEPVDMRVSVLPTPDMEDTVIRLLASKPTVMKIEDMGLEPEILEGLKKAVLAENGLIFVTGPTGSGKTTTLYSLIETINDGSRKVITVEDPIEYYVPGLTQLKLERERGLDYAQILKTILRHDPDVILIGETRDLAAAEIAVEASMTGHLVLTTLHTNSAPATVLRLINMGIAPVDVANSVTALYAQRLIKKLCPDCKRETKPGDELVTTLKAERPDLEIPKKVYEPAGCPACDQTGFRGRMPVGELLRMNDHLRDVIFKNATLVALKAAARDAGMKTMRQNALRLVTAGTAHFEDISRAVG